jgi:tRNA G18 (ribose-2'-O)-methylase SpoU
LRIIAATPRGGRPLYDVDLTGPLAVLLGGEGAGLSLDVEREADERISIPMREHVEALNVAVSAALILYEAYRQRRHPGAKRPAAHTTRQSLVPHDG